MIQEGIPSRPTSPPESIPFSCINTSEILYYREVHNPTAITAPSTTVEHFRRYDFGYSFIYYQFAKMLNVSWNSPLNKFSTCFIVFFLHKSCSLENSDRVCMYLIWSYRETPKWKPSTLHEQLFCQIHKKHTTFHPKTFLLNPEI